MAVALAWPPPALSYAVLSHEAIIDAAWEKHIKPLLLERYPQATEEDLSRAQAYAYGGAIIQDLGYYPYGSPLFSDLTHYVRSGDFIQALLDEDKALNSYRRDVSKLIPKATRIAWHLKKGEIKDDIPDATKKRFLYNLSRSNYESEWGKNYKKPSPGEVFLAFVYKLIPKFGPLKVLQFRTPTPETEHMFEASFNATLSRYRKLLAETEAGILKLENDNFDLGERTGPGKYGMNDDAHAVLLDKLAATNFAGITSETKAELLQFYADPDAPYATKRKAKAWAKVQAEIPQLKTAPVKPLTTSS